MIFLPKGTPALIKIIYSALQAYLGLALLGVFPESIGITGSTTWFGSVVGFLLICYSILTIVELVQARRKS